jgi:uncharacterized membrane protein YgcG
MDHICDGNPLLIPLFKSFYCFVKRAIFNYITKKQSTMKWQGRRKSSNIEDRRGQSGGGFNFGGSGGGINPMLLAP